MSTKTALITGSSSGIGLDAARGFLAEGYNVVISGRDGKKLKQAADKLGEEERVATVIGDIGDPETGKKIVQTAIERFGSVDVLVNNAGFAIYGTVADLKVEEIESQIATNFFGMIYCTKAFLPKMLDQKSGHIVNVASVAASFGLPGMASYCASKFAMLGFSEGLYHELKGTGVGVTVVSPIMVRTNFFDNPSFKSVPKYSPTSLSSKTVAKAVIKAASSSRLEIIVPPFVRVAVWAKQTFPYLINPILTSTFKQKQEKNSD